MRLVMLAIYAAFCFFAASLAVAVVEGIVRTGLDRVCSAAPRP